MMSEELKAFAAYLHACVHEAARLLASYSGSHDAEAGTLTYDMAQVVSHLEEASTWLDKAKEKSS